MKKSVLKSGLLTLLVIVLASCSSQPPNPRLFNNYKSQIPQPEPTRTIASPRYTPPQKEPLLRNDWETGNTGVITNDPLIKPQAYTPPEVNKMTYIVKKNDSLWLVAKKHGVSVRDLAAENSISPKSYLKIGQKLILPVGANYRPFTIKTTRKTPAPVISEGSQKYKVKRGDSLSVIAWRFKTSVTALKKHNNLKSNFLKINQTLIIPNTNKARVYKSGKKLKVPLQETQLSGSTYTIKRGDSLSVIAKKYGISTKALRNANGLKSDRIFVGKQLVIPGNKNVTDKKQPSPLQKKIQKELLGNSQKIDDLKDKEVKNEKATNTFDILTGKTDTLESLAFDFSTTKEKILLANPNLKENQDIPVGIMIKIPQN